MKKFTTLIAALVFLACNPAWAVSLVTTGDVATHAYLYNLGIGDNALPWTTQIWDPFNSQQFSVSWSNGQIGSGSALSGWIPTADGSGHSSWAPNAATAGAPTVATYIAEGVTTTGTVSSSSVCVSALGSMNGINYRAGVIDSTQSGAIQPTTYVAGIPGTCASGQVQLSLSPTPTNVGDTLNFTVSENGNFGATSQCISGLSSTAAIAVGMVVTDSTNPTNIPSGTTVTGLPGSCGTGQVEMNNPAVADETADAVVFTLSTTGTLSTASACISAPGSTTGVIAGQVVSDVTHSGSIPSGTTVVAVPGTCSSGQIQMTVNATPTNVGDTLVFGSEPSTTGSITMGSACITVGSVNGIVVGAPIFDASNTGAFPANSVVSAIPGSCSSGQVQMNANAFVTDGSDSIYFGGVIYPASGANFGEVRGTGGGGGGGGAGANEQGAGGTGSPGMTTYFGAGIFVSAGGNGGNPGGTGGYPSGGTGGIASIASITGVSGEVAQGGYGDSGFNIGGSGSNFQQKGGQGGANGISGGGYGSPVGFGGTAAAASGTPDTGSGGGGAGYGCRSVQSATSGGGGGASGVFHGFISGSSPAWGASFPYFIGFGGPPGGLGTCSSQPGTGANGKLVFVSH